MKYSRDQEGFWRSKIRKPAGRSDYSVQISHRGVRRSFALKTANKKEASSKARDVYRAVVNQGWEAAEEIYATRGQCANQRAANVGQYLAAAKAVAVIRDSTFHSYTVKLRTLLAEMFALKVGAKKFGRGADHQKWLQRIDSIRLDRIDASRVAKWRTHRINRATSEKRDSARQTTNSIIRAAKSLFSKKLINSIKDIEIPDPVPFSTVDNVTIRRKRFRAQARFADLLKKARDEMRGDDPECWIIFLLAIAVGLRRGEIDILKWSQIDFEKRTLLVQSNEYGVLKTETSEESVDVPVEILEELERFRGLDISGDQTVLSGSFKRNAADGANRYRCEKSFKRLIRWLRNSAGITAREPIHHLRGLFATEMVAAHGIYVASAALRHADIGLTRDHYTDKKEAKVVDIKGLLAADESAGDAAAG
jgi:integrase